VTFVICCSRHEADIFALANAHTPLNNHRKDEAMTSRPGNWCIAAGALAVFVGLCCLPAGLGENGDLTILALGSSIFAFGGLLISTGIYIKARMLQSEGAQAESEANIRRARGGCELCASDVPVIECRVHQLHLCSTCLAQHYDPRSCAYVPPARRGSSKPAKGLAKARGA